MAKHRRRNGRMITSATMPVNGESVAFGSATGTEQSPWVGSFATELSLAGEIRLLASQLSNNAVRAKAF